MTKKQTWEAVEALLKTHKTSPKLHAALEEILAPKSTKAEIEPPIIIAGKKFAHCRYLNLYFPLEAMAFLNDDAKAKDTHRGYSAIGATLVTRAHAAVKEKNVQIGDETVKMLSSGGIDAERLASLGAELETLKAKGIAPEYLKSLVKEGDKAAARLAEGFESVEDIEAAYAESDEETGA